MNAVPAATAALGMLRTFSYADGGAARGPYGRGDDSGDRTCTLNLGYTLGTKTVFDRATAYRIPVTGVTGRWYTSSI